MVSNCRFLYGRNGRLQKRLEKDLSVKFIKLVEVSRERHFILRLKLSRFPQIPGIKQRSF